MRSLRSSVKTKNRIESNLERFQNFVYSEDFDIVCVNETWLTENVYNAEILHSGYSVIRNDRKSRGGGVLLGIKTDIFKNVRTIEQNYKLEMSVAEIVTSTDMKFLICSCYRPPDASNTWMETFEMFLRDMCTRYSKIVITGDFNLPRACWNWQMDTSVGNEHAFVSLLNDFFLEQINKTPTRGNSIPDLVITSIPERVKVSEVLKPMSTEVSTDHSAIIFDLSLSHILNPKIKRTVFDYRRADFDGLRSHIQSLDLDKLISDHGKIDHDWFAWKNHL